MNNEAIKKLNRQSERIEKNETNNRHTDRV